MKWSNHPSLRSDGVALPDFRGLITTADGSKVLVSCTGQTVFVPRESETVAGQLLMALFESENQGYTWLNSEVCVAEGIHDPQNPLLAPATAGFARLASCLHDARKTTCQRNADHGTC
jgi:hypothetical protein